jgi:hypothetical protein
VQGYDRYAYGLNNPSRYTDPSGHMPVAGCGDEGKNACVASDLEKAINAQKLAGLEYDRTGKKQRRNSAIAKAILEDGTEFFASVLFEPADWGYTAYHCATGDCSPLMLLGLLPIIPASLGSRGDDVVDLYRAVDKSELDDILSTKSFRPKPSGGSMDAKGFWFTPNGAKGHANYWGLTDIVKAQVPRNTLEYASDTWSNLDDLGPATMFIDEGLDYFNQSIISISHIWSR